MKALQFVSLLLAFMFGLTVQAQTHKGISFLAVIKLPSGEAPTVTNVTVNARILSPNDCVLREEQFSGVNITDGYISLPVGTGSTVNFDPGLTMTQVMNNSSTFTGLTCLQANGSVNSGVTSFNPSTTNGARKFRLSLYINSVPIVADFNMRAMAYAINSETLNGLADTGFVKTSAAITQTAAETWFASTVMAQLLAGTYVATADLTTATGTLPLPLSHKSPNDPY